MRAHLIAIVAAVAATLGTTSADGARRCPPREEPRAPAPRVPATPFVENAGQWGGDVSFAAVGGERMVVLGAHAMTLVQTSDARRVAVEYAFDGARDVRPRGEAQTRAMHHYFLGSATARHARTFSSVVYDGAWPGIDLRFDAKPSAVEYSLVVQPGADASAAGIRVSGATRVERTAGGELAVTSAAGTVTHSRPVAWQEGAAGREPVDVAFDVGPRGDDGSWTYGFALGAHDPSRPVVVDPFIWGDQFDTGHARIRAVAADAKGGVYAAGWSNSVTDVPSDGGSFDTTLAGSRDAWVARLDPGGDVLWATFLGGAAAADTPDFDEADEIAVASDGSVVVAGSTSSGTFPVVAGPDLHAQFRPSMRNAWIARLSADGATLIHSGILGGDDEHVAVGPDATAYVAWDPGTYTAGGPGAYIPASHGDGFAVTWVARLSPQGSVVQLTELRAPSPVSWLLAGIAVDASGAVHLSGTARRADALPAAPVSNTFGGGSSDAFVMKLDPSGTSLEYALYVGGAGEDAGGGVVVDGDGAAHVVGSTRSTLATFPRTVGPATGTSSSVPGSAFVARVPAAAADGVTVVALGSSAVTSPYVITSSLGIGIDSLDRVYATAFGSMWRFDPDGTTGACSGSGFGASPVAGQPGVLWFASLRLTRYAEESLGAPDHVEAVGYGIDAVRFSWIPRNDAATALIVERATGYGPFADVAAIAGDATYLADEGGLAPDTLYRYRVRSVTDGVESLRSEVASARTDGTLRLRVARRRVADRGQPARDLVRARGTFRPVALHDVAFDPAADAVRVTVGNSFVVDVPAGDAGWARERGADVWSGEVFGGEVTLRIDTERRTFSVVASGMDLPRPRPRSEAPAVSLRIGNDGGSVPVRKR